jgi:hypothetical protein
MRTKDILEDDKIRIDWNTKTIVIKESGWNISVLIYKKKEIQQSVKDELERIHGKSQSEISKNQLFTEVFNALSGQNKSDVEGKVLINELIQTGRFSKSEIDKMIQKAIEDGYIFERIEGWYGLD